MVAGPQRGRKAQHSEADSSEGGRKTTLGLAGPLRLVCNLLAIHFSASAFPLDTPLPSPSSLGVAFSGKPLAAPLSPKDEVFSLWNCGLVIFASSAPFTGSHAKQASCVEKWVPGILGNAGLSVIGRLCSLSM